MGCWINLSLQKSSLWCFYFLYDFLIYPIAGVNGINPYITNPLRVKIASIYPIVNSFFLSKSTRSKKWMSWPLMTTANLCQVIVCLLQKMDEMSFVRLWQGYYLRSIVWQAILNIAVHCEAFWRYILSIYKGLNSSYHVVRIFHISRVFFN